MTSRCQGLTRDGRPCGVRPLRGADHCINHTPDPDLIARRDEARHAGGRSRGIQLQRTTVPPLDLDLPPTWWKLGAISDVIGAYAWIVRELASGRLDARTANALTGTLGGLVGALREGDLERRLLAMEAALSTRRRRP